MLLTSHAKKFLFILLLGFTSSLPAIELSNPELMGSDGKNHHLQDFMEKGKWTVVIVWGPKCPACVEEMPDIQGLYDDRKETGINVIGLALDYPTFSAGKIKQVQQFEEDYFITFPNLLISANSFYDFGLGVLQGTPTIILVDSDAKVSAVQLGGVPRDVIEKYINQQQLAKVNKHTAVEN